MPDSPVKRKGVSAPDPVASRRFAVTVTDPAGATTLTQSRISVRSTAFSVVGLLAVVGSALVLLAWGVRQSLRRRRGARDRAAGGDVDAEVA